MQEHEALDRYEFASRLIYTQVKRPFRQVMTGSALRPFGAPLYSYKLRSAPALLPSLRRRPAGQRTKRIFKPYLGYLLRPEAKFVDKPILQATTPELRRLSPT